MRLGVSTFSLTNEWLSRRYTLESLLERVAEAGLGPGLEVIGHQTWRGYPRLPREDVLGFRRLCERLGLEPAAIGGYVDLLRRPGSAMTVEECVDALEAQIEAASRLGFPVIRLHVGVPVPAIEQALQAAERAGVVLATEFQGPQTPDDPSLQALLELRERAGESPAIALVLDFSVAMRAIPTTFADAVRSAGMARGDLDRIVELWRGGANVGELFAAIAATDAPGLAQDEARSGFVRFGRQDPAVWAPLVPLIAHAHAKFWEIDEAGDDPTTDNRGVVDTLLAGGFRGVVASEWGGSAWVDLDDVDGFAIVAQHQRLLGRLSQQTPASAPA
jgi:Xylose isomerase-like TIM barrel